MHSRAMVPAPREQFISVEAEPKQGEIQQDFVQGSLQKPHSLYAQRPDKSVLFAACVLTTILFLGLISFVFFKVFYTVHDVTAFRVGHQKMVSQYIGGGGIIHPRQQVTVSYPAQLHIVDVLVKEGDAVKQGQPLIKLDPDQVNAQVNRAQDDVDAAQNYLDSVSGAGNSVAIAGANHALEEAQSRLKALQAQTSSILHDDQLISPIQGVVTNLNAAPGLQFGTNAALLTIVDQSECDYACKDSPRKSEPSADGNECSGYAFSSLQSDLHWDCDLHHATGRCTDRYLPSRCRG